MNYIKKLVFLNENTNEEQKLEFKVGTNIIIGQKGGGKSTLLNLLYAMFKKTKLPGDVNKALKAIGIVPMYIEYQNGDTTNIKELSNVNNSEEIIVQTDDIKTRLTEAKQIQEDRERFVKNLIGKQAAEIVNLFKEYFHTFFTLYDLRTRNISWNSISKLENDSIDINVNIMTKLNDDYKKINTFNERTFEHNVKSIAILESYITLNENNESSDINNFIKKINEIIRIHKKISENEIFKKNISNSIKETLQELNRYLKERQNKEINLPLFKTNALGLFDDFAKTLSDNIVYFEFIMKSNISFHVKGKEKTQYDLDIFIDDQIDLDNDDEAISEILSHSLHKAKNDTTR
ncbi:MAG: ATP-binding protein [Elusimicrobiota bacterium]|jgi:energy-coupling factor transporter ATP-binding protein EcfA2|nr:ATP-binding protein [Elusimicrobiota bacterium]